MPPRSAAAVYGGFMAVLAFAAGLLPDGGQALRAVAGFAAVTTIVLGMRRNLPADRAPWLLLAAGVGLSALGAVPYGVGPMLNALSYPVLATVLLIFVRRRTWRAGDRAPLLDALAVSSSLALLSWTFLIGPRLDGGFAEIAVPLGDLLCAGVLARLLSAAGRRVLAGHLLVVGVVTLLVADVAYQLSVLGGAGVGRFVLYAGAGLAAMHPTMNSLSVPAGARPTEVSRARLAVLGLASMAAPAVLLTKMFRDGGAGDLIVAAVLSALTFLLVLVRMAGIMASHRQALARERGLREASAALVSVADVDGVGDAVRAAVAQLLPADTPHSVVLALAFAQVGPLSPEASAQAALDRAAGTAARLVATREVDWAVAVRLAPFSTTLRCPMVLGDRPAGDPLVGVLHVGAPAWALPGLQRAAEVLAGQAALAIERIALSQELIRQNSETYFRTLVQNTADVILIVGEDEGIRYASPSAVRVFGADPTGARLTDVIHPGDRGRLGEVLAAVLGGESLQEGQDFRAVGEGLVEVLLEMHCRDLRAEPTVAGLVITLRDVTERRRLERELTHQAFHDSMTGLANRVLFHDRLRHALARGARDGSVVGVLFIDLDDFKIVNDTLGHAAGDQLLITVAERIAGALRADDTAARLGGDEFAALVENVQDPGAVEETAQRILAALAEPVVVDGETTLNAVASIGITTTPEADTADELLRQADLALYVAKGAGKNQWRRYQAHLHGAMVARLELRSALDHAVHEGHFTLAYQPIVDLATDEPVGFEALVRWFHPTKGIVSPAEFIEVAEESGLVVPMGRWVLQQALHTVAQWRRILPRSRRPYVSVNVSARQFRESGFVEEILHALDYAEVPPGALMLELTGTPPAGDDPIREDLATLRRNGVRIAVDDSGAGRPPLDELRRWPVDVIKIDRMAVDGARITEMVGLARSLGLTLIAEGIESPADRDLFARLGCPLGQGYFFSSPVDGTEALSRMTNRQRLVA